MSLHTDLIISTRRGGGGEGGGGMRKGFSFFFTIWYDFYSWKKEHEKGKMQALYTAWKLFLKLGLGMVKVGGRVGVGGGGGSED